MWMCRLICLIPGSTGAHFVCIFRLTKKEKQDLEYKKTVLKLAKEHRDAKQIEKVNRYYIPKDDEKPQDKYVEEEGPKGIRKIWTPRKLLQLRILKFVQSMW